MAMTMRCSMFVRRKSIGKGTWTGQSPCRVAFWKFAPKALQLPETFLFLAERYKCLRLPVQHILTNFFVAARGFPQPVHRKIGLISGQIVSPQHERGVSAKLILGIFHRVGGQNSVGSCVGVVA